MSQHLTRMPLTRRQFTRLAAALIASAGIGTSHALSWTIAPRAALADTLPSQGDVDSIETGDSHSAVGSTRTPSRTRIILATDLHYLAPELVEAGKLADVGVISSGTMVTRYTDAIADAMAAAVIAARPDAFVMPGDLTYNGERESHVAFVEKLRAIADTGVPVLVIPGNHDVKGTPSVQLKGAETRDHFTAADWFELYSEFGVAAPGVLDRDDASFSYVWCANPDLRLLFVDCNAVDDMWTVPASTLAWIERQLCDAQVSGARVIAFSHQNLLGAGGYNGLMMANGEQVEALYERYGVIGNFSGHMHGQSVLAREDGLFDVVTSALSIWPLRYATIDVLTREGAARPSRQGDVIDIGAGAALRELSPASYGIVVERAPSLDPESEATAVDARASVHSDFAAVTDPYADGRVDYATALLDVSSWAAATGNTNPDLLDFDAYGQQFIYDAQYSTMLTLLEGLEASTEDAVELADYFARVSVAYAAGTQSDIENRPDLLERFLEAAGDTTATRFSYAFDPTRLRTADAFEARLG